MRESRVSRVRSGAFGLLGAATGLIAFAIASRLLADDRSWAIAFSEGTMIGGLIALFAGLLLLVLLWLSERRRSAG